MDATLLQKYKNLIFYDNTKKFHFQLHFTNHKSQITHITHMWKINNTEYPNYNRYTEINDTE